MESTEPPNESNAKLISSLRGELENVKLAASLLEETKNEEIGVIKQKYEGEVSEKIYQHQNVGFQQHIIIFSLQVFSGY